MNKKITILALGGAGCKIVSLIAGTPSAAGVRLLAIDTDAESLAACGLPESDRLLAAAQWRGGRGCGGNAQDGQRAIAHERHNIEKMLAECEFLVLVAGMGRGTASGGAQVILSIAAKLKIPNLVLLTLPFAMERPSRYHLAERIIENELFSTADAVIALPNDLLFATRPAETPLAEAFRTSDLEVARTALALSHTLAAGNLIGSDFAALTELLKRRRSLCGIGVGSIDLAAVPEGRGAAVVEQLLNSPLLGGSAQLHDADAVVLSLLGGPELSLGDAKETLELAGRYTGTDTELVVAASTSPEWKGTLQLTALAIRFSEETELKKRPAAGKDSGDAAAAHQGKPMQMELFSFDQSDKGEMERTTPVIWNGEDLDEPTFKRRKISLDLGKHLR